MTFQTRFYLILLKILLIYGISNTFKEQKLYLLTGKFMTFQTQKYIPVLTSALALKIS